LKLNGTYQLIFDDDEEEDDDDDGDDDDVNILGGSINAMKKNSEALVVTGKEMGLEINADKTK
jgi:hypothetical protein